jgi:hypothetical protein
MSSTSLNLCLVSTLATAVASPGAWVRIRRVELGAADRADSLPPDTAGLPFLSWMNGFLVAEARLGERATIRTLIGRECQGELVAIRPGYAHTFGAPPPPLQEAGVSARAVVRGGS